MLLSIAHPRHAPLTARTPSTPPDGSADPPTPEVRPSVAAPSSIVTTPAAARPPRWSPKNATASVTVSAPSRFRSSDPVTADTRRRPANSRSGASTPPARSCRRRGRRRRDEARLPTAVARAEAERRQADRRRRGRGWRRARSDRRPPRAIWRRARRRRTAARRRVPPRLRAQMATSPCVGPSSALQRAEHRRCLGAERRGRRTGGEGGHPLRGGAFGSGAAQDLRAAPRPRPG
mgnify:CR=1 FL=1